MSAVGLGVPGAETVCTCDSVRFGRSHDPLLGTSGVPTPGAVARIRSYLSLTPVVVADLERYCLLLVSCSGGCGAVDCAQHSYHGVDP